MRYMLLYVDMHSNHCVAQHTDDLQAGNKSARLHVDALLSGLVWTIWQQT